MLDEFVIGSDDQGNLTFIQSPDISFLTDLGQASVRRASHVEPDKLPLRIAFHLLRKAFGESGKVANWTRNWKCLWRVNMLPSNGPILGGRWSDRQDALDAEVSWLREHM